MEQILLPLLTFYSQYIWPQIHAQLLFFHQMAMEKKQQLRLVSEHLGHLSVRGTPECSTYCSGRKSPSFPAFYVFFLLKYIFNMHFYKWVSHNLTFTGDKCLGEVNVLLLLTYQATTVPKHILSGNKQYSFCFWLSLYCRGPFTRAEFKSLLYKWYNAHISSSAN